MHNRTTVLRILLGVALLIALIGGFWQSVSPSLAQTTNENLSEPPNPPSVLPDAPQANEWPQVQFDAQHTGHIAETPSTTNFGVTWTHPFQPEKIFPQVQAIVCSGKVFVGTEMGNLYALNANDGKQAWKASIGAPILASAACNTSNGKVFVGAMNGTVYGINISNGSIAWQQTVSTRLGFSTAPIIADNKVLIGGRNGIFYAFDFNGTQLWSYTVGSPILQTAAANGGRVVFGAMDMRVYALNTTTGALAWKSTPLKGMAIKDYWPLIYNGKVFVLVTGGRKLGVDNGTQVTSTSAQQAILNSYDANPGNYEKSLYTLNETNGNELPAMIYYPEQNMHGAPSTPCVDRDGLLIIPAPKPNGDFKSGWARLNTNTRMITAALSDGTDNGYGNGDETFNVTCAGDIIFTFHTQEGNAHDTGFYNLATGTWKLLAAGHTNKQFSTNTQGGGGNPASVVNGIVYHISWHELIARSAR
jgi:outer membrane protein assembly factor BamB